MSELKTNKISTNDQNNVAIDNALGLKSYTTAQRDALTSAAGDMIYNTTTTKVEYYNGSAWQQTGADTFSIEYLVVAGGGGAGGNYTGYNGYVNGGGGGAGGYRNSYASETSGGNSSTEPTFKANKSVNYTVTVGGGGTGSLTVDATQAGSDSVFATILSLRGGGGGGWGTKGSSGGSRGGHGAGSTNDAAENFFIPSQGSDGGTSQGSLNKSGGGGGGASAAGGTGGNTTTGGNGGNGLASSITGSAVTRAGGGGGSGYSTGGTGGTGGGGNGGTGFGGSSTAASANTGSGGGGSSAASTVGSNGGSGTVILRWATADATISPTRTGLTDGGVQTDGADSYIVFTAGTGTISFS